MGCGASSTPAAVESRSATAPTVTVPGELPMAGVIHVRNIPKPLVMPLPYRHPTTMTMGDLNNRRNDFWNTRSAGNIHMWQAIRSAAEALIADDLPLASAVLEASNMITANGSLELCYDELQRPYITPLFCMVNPSNILHPNKPQNNILPNKIIKSISQSTMIAQPINLKVRINPGDFNLNIAASTADSIQDLKHYILESSQQLENVTMAIPICDELRQRVIFMGQELQNAQILGDVGVDESKVMQVFLRPLPLPVLEQ